MILFSQWAQLQAWYSSLCRKEHFSGLRFADWITMWHIEPLTVSLHIDQTYASAKDWRIRLYKTGYHSSYSIQGQQLCIKQIALQRSLGLYIPGCSCGAMHDMGVSALASIGLINESFTTAVWCWGVAANTAAPTQGGLQCRKHRERASF